MAADRFRRQILTERDRDVCMRAAQKAPMGYHVEIRPPTRSLDQNARCWAMLDDIAEQVEWYGKKMSSDSWKCVFSAALKKQEAVPGIDGGFVVIGAYTSRMSVAEMGDMMTLMEAFGAEHSVTFTAPDHLNPSSTET